jgi:hypothetical protein
MVEFNEHVEVAIEYKFRHVRVTLHIECDAQEKARGAPLFCGRASRGGLRDVSSD